jgi:hypothetical protein
MDDAMKNRDLTEVQRDPAERWAYITSDGYEAAKSFINQQGPSEAQLRRRAFHVFHVVREAEAE